MKIGIYDPYLDTLGGGEKYIFSIAECLAKDHKIYLFWDDNNIIEKARQRFNLNLSHLNFEKNIFSNGSFFKRCIKTRNFDVVIYISDGSIPFLFGRKNILLFQFPVNWVHGNSLLIQLKLKNIHQIICYSQFVKRFIEQTFHVNSKVLPPAIKPISAQNVKKENIILSVGRFTKGMNRKKQEILVNAFKVLFSNGLKDWEFVLIGSFLPRDQDFVSSIQNAAKNYPIKILVNIPYKNLVEYYQKAKIYWHAAGFGEDLEKQPERAEHFGITTVEAMSAGDVPVVINAGGQKEIVEDGKNGFLWDTLDELEEKTLQLIKNEKLWQEMSNTAKKRAEFFAGDHFCKEITNIIEG